MMQGEAEHAFREFRVCGQPRAMARVFDLTAQELLLVAGNLSRGVDEAEELVQQTFLEALQHAERWDETRPLLPWLLGILLRLRRGRQRRRAEERGRERALELDTLGNAAATDPVRLAEEAELAAALARALAALPEAYRDSLSLRLVHGLEPVQIAHALGRPLETVKTQLKRGKQFLRDALPRSLAGLVLFEPDGLGDVRRLVLGEARRLGAGSSLVGAGVGATIAMKKILVVVALVGAGLWWWSRSERGTRVSVEEVGVALPASEVARTEAPALVAQPPAPVDSTREALPPERPSSPAPASAHAELRCRVVWDTDGTPAADVRLELYLASFGDVTAPQLATSDADGLALFTTLEPGHVWVGTDRGGEVDGMLAVGANELELRIPDGVDVEGVVLDERDQLVADAELWLSGSHYYLGAGLWTERSRADGQFYLRDVQAGRALAARAPGRAAAPGVLVDGEPGEVRQVTLRVGALGPRVRGIVRAAGGAPLAGALVFLGSAQDTRHTIVDGVRALLSPPAQSVSTGADGRFEAESVPTKVPLPVWACTEGFAVWHENVMVSEPETWIEIELARGVSVSGVVRDEQGNPVARLEVFAVQKGIDPEGGFWYGGPTWGQARTWSAADGSFRLERVRPGPVTLFAQDPGASEARAEVELVSGQDFRWDAVLRGGGDIAGVVVDESGTPLVGLVLRGSAEGDERHSLGTTRTDSDGFFRLTGAVRESYSLRIAEASCDLDAPLYVEGVTPSRSGREFVFPDRNRASARLIGRLTVADGSPFEPQNVRVRRIEPDSTLRSGGSQTRTVEGRFETGLLPPGRYVLTASSQAAGHWIVGTFELAAGEVRDVGTHACPAPGSIACEVFDAAGAPLGAGEVWALSEASEVGKTAKILDGRGTCGPLQPGIYWIGFAGYDLPLVRSRVEVRAGESAQATIHIPAALPRWVQVPSGPSKSMLLVTYEWRRDGELVNRHGSMIGLGRQKPCEMKLVPGHYEVVLTLEDGRSATTSFEVSASTTAEEQAIALRSPLDE